jgi:hypothetical protein
MSEIIYSTSGPWGDGVGRPLTAAEMDSNFRAMGARLDAVPLAPTNALQVALLDKTGAEVASGADNVAGVRYTIVDPVWEADGVPYHSIAHGIASASSPYMGVYRPNADYAAGHIITQIGDGLYLVLHDHTSAGPRIDMASGHYFRINGEPYIADVQFHMPSTYSNRTGPMFQMVMPRPMFLTRAVSPTWGGGWVWCDEAPVDDLSMIVTHNGAHFGRVHVKAGEMTGTVELFGGQEARQFLKQDILAVHRPGYSPGDGTESEAASMPGGSGVTVLLKLMRGNWS